MAATVHSIRRGPPAIPPMGDWRARLKYEQTSRGDQRILHWACNAITVLRNDPAWAGVLAYDELSQAIVCRKAPPWLTDARYIDDAPADRRLDRPWDDLDGVRVQTWLQRCEWELNVSPTTAYTSALMVAKANAYDPLVDYIDGVQRDQFNRVDRWLHLYLGVEDTAYSRLVGRIFLLGSVARVYEPGCQFDTMLVLEGDQDLGKSKAGRALFSNAYFRESPLDLHNNDRFLAMRGCWCREWPELDGLGKADINRVKSFITARYDDFRAPYERHMVHVARRPVLLATVNPPQLGYLTDETGNRRMLPVVCGVTGPIDHEGLVRDRDAIWAEARDMYRAGVLYYAATPAEKRLCNGEQTARMVAEVWEGKIADWVRQPPRDRADAEITIRQVLGEALSIPTERMDRGNSARVGAALARLGWVVAASRRTENGRERVYTRRPVVAAQPDPDHDGREAMPEAIA